MIHLQGNEVAVFPHVTWSKDNLASRLGSMSTSCTQVCILADLNATPHPNQREHEPGGSQQDIFRPLVEWIRAGSPGLTPLLADASDLDPGEGGLPRNDPKGLTTINLGDKSLFYGLKGRRYFGTQTDIGETNRHHHDSIQEYQLGRSILDSDAVVNVTAMQTHGLAGISAALHSAIGISASSNWLPHHSIGTPKTGGDSFPDSAVRPRLKCAFLGLPEPTRRLLRHVGIKSTSKLGTWWGNDTFWRTILDLNRALLYARADGSLAGDRQRETLAVVKVPAAPAPARPSLIVAGPNPCAVDLVCARLMGFDWKRIPHLLHVFDDHDLPLVDFRYEDIVVRSEIGAFDRRLVDMDSGDCGGFPAPAGWTGWLEAHDG